MSTISKISNIHFLNHDVLHIRTQKPDDFQFTPGQATDIAINKEEWKDEKRPFTMTSLPEDDFLEFTIKVYPSHDGVTEQLSKLKEGDTLLIGDTYGAIEYKGPGVFIAGGAGITPFISIFKSLEKKNESKNNQLLFANKRERDIIYQSKFEAILGDNFTNILSEEDSQKYASGYIDKEFIKDKISDVDTYFYVCGPPKMMEAVLDALNALDVWEENIIKENFDD